jgi:type IV secretion system protein VirB6
MSGSFQIFEPAYTFIDGKLDTFLNADASNVIAQVAGPMRAALVLYVLLYGFAILRGAVSEPVIDFAVRSLKLAFIYMLATTVAYSSWVTTPLFQTMPNALTQALGGSVSTDPGAAFDQFFARAAYLGEKISQTANMTNPAPWLEAGAVDVIGGLAAALGFGVVIVAKVSLALIIALGPAFIACSLFDASRRFFFGWLSQAVNYLVLMALIIAVFQMILSLVGSQWGQIDGQDPMAGGLIFIALSILGAIFFLQTPAIAAGIAGGASAGLADFGNAAGMAFRGGPRFNTWRTQGGRTQVPRTGGSLRPTGARA